MTVSSDAGTFVDAVKTAASFVYDHVVGVVVVSILWFVAVLPVVTVGVATLGAFTAIQTIERDGHVDWGEVRERVVQNGLHATFLAPLPGVFGGTALLYITGAVGSVSPLQTAIAGVSFYVALYLVLVLMPTFGLLAAGADVWGALARGRSWVGAHPTLAFGTAFVSALLFVATGLLTIAFPLLFAGLAVSVQVLVLQASGTFDDTVMDSSTSRPPHAD